jgi:hypothetical protein
MVQLVARTLLRRVFSLGKVAFFKFNDPVSIEHDSVVDYNSFDIQNACGVRK